ncbi:UDP-2,4-diacetamido-2,4,6-trideoxy-beta-L-altropyranose hydrolase [Riemerella anatipestifer]|uniref:UDP-2,4-diacetamido-2,4, 6-trideoxy-beta-L-altropyranose hydrolase n=1 Tax=Riemerella anatipestifer TaxID=34085 RepID=UPI002A8CCB94|nr:UDP-2,4-diacetamido-2,4,6-trideoxy-beta-L-altropyranose hydrolase [Riemerella anatipestifer]
MIYDRIIIRLDAGIRYGLGHLSRCITIANASSKSEVVFIIKTDDKELVKNYIDSYYKHKFILINISEDTSISDEINTIAEYCVDNYYLIVDHYSANENYQIKLFNKKINWLQLDSHAKYKFYSNFVLHGSPGATLEIYDPLKQNPNTKFLLGTNYAIIKDTLQDLKHKRIPRKKINNIVISFGGGDDRGMTIKCLESIDFKKFKNLKFRVTLNKKNRDYPTVYEIIKNNEKIDLFEPKDLHKIMSESDLSIIAPGMTSYESAYLGLPMLFYTLADNQLINAKSWENTGCAVNIADIDKSYRDINCILEDLISSDIFQKMSEKCLSLVDGDGVKRVIEAINL